MSLEIRGVDSGRAAHPTTAPEPRRRTAAYDEQPHNRCPACRYIEPCRDGAPPAVCETRQPERSGQ